MASLRILAVDPGVTVGVATKIGDNYMALEVGTKEDVWNFLRVDWDYVVVERFKTAGMISVYGLHTVEMVGGLQGICHVKSIPLTFHPPAKRKAFMREAASILTAKKVHFSKADDHAHDALAHLLAFEYYMDHPSGIKIEKPYLQLVQPAEEDNT